MDFERDIYGENLKIELVALVEFGLGEFQLLDTNLIDARPGGRLRRRSVARPPADMGGARSRGSGAVAACAAGLVPRQRAADHRRPSVRDSQAAGRGRGHQVVHSVHLPVQSVQLRERPLRGIPERLFRVEPCRLPAEGRTAKRGVQRGQGGPPGGVDSGRSRFMWPRSDYRLSQGRQRA